MSRRGHSFLVAMWILVIILGALAFYVNFRAARRLAEVPKFTIALRQFTTRPYTVENPPHSVRVFAADLQAAGMRVPPNGWANQVEVTNIWNRQVTDLRIRLEITHPFAFVNVFFSSPPQAEWRVTPDETRRVLVLERLRSTDPGEYTKIGYVYTYPSNYTKVEHGHLLVTVEERYSSRFSI